MSNDSNTSTASGSQRPFRFGVQFYDPSSATQWREQARRAEELGYSSFHLADHVIGPGEALAPTRHPVQTVAAIPAMAVAAEATSSIRIGCRVLCCDYRHPVMLAKELATIDFFSGGRLEIGLGAGWLANEYEAMGVPFLPAGRRIDRLVETVRLLRACFSGEQLDVEGTYVHAVGFQAVPVPTTTPPLMIGGGSPRILGVAGREAEIVSLNFDNSSGRIGVEGVGSSTADATKQKLEWIRAGAGDRFDDIELEIAAYFTAVTDDRAAALESIAGRFGMAGGELADHPHALIGTVESICEQLVERRERYGISYITVGRTAMEMFSPVVARLAGT